MREIKFRAWIEKFGQMRYDILNLGEYTNSILMQFTGLKDKNGKEIYEGDIVKEVFFETEETRLELFYVCEFYMNNLESGFSFRCIGSGDKIRCVKDIEVIGNIYENPDLVEEGK